MELKQLKCANCNNNFEPKDGETGLIITSPICSIKCSLEALDKAKVTFKKLEEIKGNPEAFSTYLESLDTFSMHCILQLMASLRKMSRENHIVH